ncbi:Thioredoxin reductase [Labilithrix luteola]|uniref:Thioredoxin reductase n=1 Tax=Labilithrix luteola TaxID=1391654 RepID=A0A0K1Q458_9BACT|nr:cyclic nucleotide-binding domain-containing thioredoxin-disulfide reductase [Labilithrix luteola]AKV00616.1 Thioredoxin reductase [Labilithrix luteola]
MGNGLPSLDELETRRAQMFPSLSPSQVAKVATFGTEQQFKAGDIVFEQGDTNVPFFVVVEGAMEIVHPHGIGLEDHITTHHPREFTGEVTLLTDRRSLVRARANTDLRVIRVEQSKLRAIIQTEAELSELIMRAFILRRVGLLSTGYGDIVVIGSRDSAATLRLQEFLVRNGHPCKYLDVDRDADVQQLLDQFHVGVKDIPILICRGDVVLRNPTEAEVAECLGFNAAVSMGVVRDVIVCGAGPGGLAAAVYGASEGLDVLVIETSSPGGQAASSSKIENYLGFPTGVSGQALTGRALTQAEKFGAQLAVARGAVRLHCDETPMRIELANGESVRARSIVLATGAQYNKLDVPELHRFEGVGIYYAATYVESQRCGENEVIVVGGGNSAGQAATFLARSCTHVHMLIRGPDLAASMSRYLIRRIEETPNITLRRRTKIIALDGDEHLEYVTWRDEATGEVSKRPIRHVFSMAGASPNTEWLRGCVAMDPKGFVYAGTDVTHAMLDEAKWPLERQPMLFETSQPRVFAVGDVRANSVKRVASAVGEGSVCIQLVHKVLGE